MKIVALAARKGGCGKTTLTTHLAVAAHQAGWRTKIVDLDPQTTASEWADGRGDDGLDVISAQPARLKRVLEAIREDTDIVFVDTPPAAGDAGNSAIEAADLVLIPTRIQASDISAVLRTHETATNAKKTSFVVFNDESPQRRKSIVEETRAVLATKKIETGPVVIHTRIAYGESQDGGRTVLETEPTSNASDEMRQLYAWVAGQLDLKVENPESPKGAKSKSAKGQE